MRGLPTGFPSTDDPLVLERQTSPIVQSENGYYDGVAGRIHYRSWSAADPAFVILLAHGFGDHSGRWQRYGEVMAENGGAVFACDHMGHGRSDGVQVVITDFADVARDFLALRHRSSFPSGVPLILAGHSMGGIVVTCAALLGELRPSALVVSGTQLAQWPVADVLPTGHGNPLFDPDASLAADALSRDPAIVNQFKGDALTYAGTMPSETIAAWGKAVERLERAGQGTYDFPVLYLHGGDDPIINHRGSLHRITELAAEDLEVRIFPETRHSLFNELNRDEIYGVLLSFIRRVVGQDGARGALETSDGG